MTEFDSGRQRTLAPGTRLANAARIFVQEGGHALEIAKRGSDREIVSGPALQQQPDGFDVGAAFPERNVDRLEISRRIACGIAGARAVQGMDVGAAIEQ